MPPEKPYAKVARSSCDGSDNHSGLESIHPAELDTNRAAPVLRFRWSGLL